jgi:hypothetical protein
MAKAANTTKAVLLINVQPPFLFQAAKSRSRFRKSFTNR